MGFLEPVGAPQRPNLGQLADDVLLGLAAAGDLLQQSALLLLGVCAQHTQRIDAVEDQLIDDLGVGAVDGTVCGFVRGGDRFAHRSAR